MCFSATASFSASAFLFVAAAVTLKSVRHRREMPFAAIPLLFGIHQFCEGVIWLTFSHPAPLLNAVMTHAYSLFSHVLWPVYVPIAVVLIEAPGPRRRILCAFAAAGLAVGGYLLYIIVAFPVIALAAGHHIEYVSPHFLNTFTMLLYLMAVTVTPMLSSHRMVNLFGALALLSFGAAYYFYMTWFISVWCLFAAILSGAVLWHFASGRAPRAALPVLRVS